MPPQLAANKHFTDSNSSSIPNHRDTFSTSSERAIRDDFFDDSVPFSRLSKNLCQTFVWRLVDDASMDRISSR
jgi:hypothetical protein